MNHTVEIGLERMNLSKEEVIQIRMDKRVSIKRIDIQL
jgi:hypothetical protein